MFKDQKILEVVSNWPAEVFIQRHIEALSEHGLTPIVVAHHNDETIARSAKLQRSIQLLKSAFRVSSSLRKMTQGKQLIGKAIRKLA